MTDKHPAASHPRTQENSTAMSVKERADAIVRAKRALKALAEHPRATRKQLGVAKEQLNDCYRLSEPGAVWAAAQAIEASAAAVYGVPNDEPMPKAVRHWITPRGGSRPAKPRRPRRVPGN
jgi:hypothetical protein